MSHSVDLGELDRVRWTSTFDGISWEILDMADNIRARADQVDGQRAAANLRALADALTRAVKDSQP